MKESKERQALKEFFSGSGQLADGTLVDFPVPPELPKLLEEQLQDRPEPDQPLNPEENKPS